MLRLMAWPSKGGFGGMDAAYPGVCSGTAAARYTSGNFLYCIEWMPAGKAWMTKLIRKGQVDAALLQRQAEVYNNTPLRKCCKLRGKAGGK